MAVSIQHVHKDRVIFAWRRVRFPIQDDFIALGVNRKFLQADDFIKIGLKLGGDINKAM